MLKLGFKTNIFDVNGVELKVGDEILPTKFRDIPSVVVFCSDGEFYRVKKHLDNYYFNPLGTCKVKKVSSLNENQFDVYIKSIIECQKNDVTI
jgi:hypothetical protein